MLGHLSITDSLVTSQVTGYFKNGKVNSNSKKKLKFELDLFWWLRSYHTPSQSHKDIPSLESLKKHFWEET